MRPADGVLWSWLMVAVGGCMKIYADPELPDVSIEWFESDCRSGANVTALLAGVDDSAFTDSLTVPCSDRSASFVNVPRQRFQLAVAIQIASGAEVGHYAEDVDLRSGLDKTVSVFFGVFENVRVGFGFAMDASCQSLGANSITTTFTSTTFPEPIELATPCGTDLITSLPAGTYTARATAHAVGTSVAVSPPSEPVVIDDGSFGDFGTLVLSPCGASCP